MPRKEGVMPREAVWGTNDFLPEDAEDGGAIVDVRWNRDQHVQVVTRREFAEVPPPDEPISYKYGMYVDLDRTGINTLIRNLRRARDQAFGRDE